MRLTARLVALPSPTKRFDHELVFEDLTDKIETLTPYRVRQVATGSVKKPAMRVRVGSPSPLNGQLDLANVSLRAQPDSTHRTLNCRVAFIGLEEALASRGIRLSAIETRENGRGTPIALRFLLDGYSGDVENFGSTELVTSDRPRGQGFVADAKRRKAIEDRAVQVAVDCYRKEYGGDVEIRDTGASCPYDLELCPSGLTIRVEVKGMSGEGNTVVLTHGEVDHAALQDQEGYRVDLVVVTNIEVRQNSGAYLAAGGDIYAWVKSWKPNVQDLKPTQYRYSVLGESLAGS